MSGPLLHRPRPRLRPPENYGIRPHAHSAVAFSTAIRPVQSPRSSTPSPSFLPSFPLPLCLSRQRRRSILLARSFVRPSSCSPHHSAASRSRSAPAASISVSDFQSALAFCGVDSGCSCCYFDVHDVTSRRLTSPRRRRRPSAG